MVVVLLAFVLKVVGRLFLLRLVLGVHLLEKTIYEGGGQGFNLG